MSLANSALRVSARNRVDGASFEQTTELFPVLIGRDPTVATVVLPENLKVSRVHASLELRGDELYVRDARSVNGTVVNGQSIPPETWVPLGRGDVPREFAISDWVFTVVCVQAPQAVTVADNSFGNEQGHRVLGLHATIASAALADTGRAAFGKDGAPQAATPEPDGLEITYERYHLASKELYELLVHELDAMSIGERRAAATVMARRFSMLADDPAFAALLRNYGATLGSTPSSPPASQHPQVSQAAAPVHEMGATQPMPQVTAPPPPAKVHIPGPVTTPEGVALKAMQYLSTWYVGRATVTTADIGSFTDQLRATLDELMRGHVPLLAGLDRFEQQLALTDDDGNNFELPRTPVDFARALLDWNDTSGNPVRALRRSFADLMVHQVGMLNGIMRGVKVLLTELSPTTIEHAWNVKNDRRSGLARLFGRWHKDREMVAMFAERHSDLADEENETFRLLFGPEFVREYKLLAQEQAQSLRPQQLGPGDRPGAGPSTARDQVSTATGPTRCDGERGARGLAPGARTPRWRADARRRRRKNDVRPGTPRAVSWTPALPFDALASSGDPPPLKISYGACSI